MFFQTLCNHRSRVRSRMSDCLTKTMLVMKLTAILLLAGFLQVSARGTSQTVTYQAKSASLPEVFAAIKQQTGYVFFYNKRDLKTAIPVSVTLHNVPLREALDAILANESLGFIIQGNTIVITARPATPDLQPGAASPPADSSKMIKGKIVDDKGQPMEGVSVFELGGSAGTTTNAQGLYHITLKHPERAELAFSYIGFQTVRIKVGHNTSINLSMSLSTSGLNDVVVVGYGTQKRKDLTGAISSVDLTRAQDLPNTNITETIQGTLPGVNVVPNGRPGSGGSILVRGQRSISASNTPLVVLDGVIFDGSLADVNPADIGSVDVLKDVSSTAIYGSRGANGVILITTRKAATGKPTINFTMLYGRSDYARRLPLLDRNGYLKKVIDYQYDLMSDGTTPQGPVPINPADPQEYLQNPSEVTGYANGTNTDWNDVVKQPAPQTTYDLSIAGRTSNSSYLFSGDYTDQKGIMLNDNFKRYSFRLNLESSITPWLKIGTNSFFEEMNQSGIPSTLLGQLTLISPLVKPRDSLGNIVEFPMDDQGYINPLENSLAQNLNVSTNLTGTMYASVDIPYIKGLNYRVNWSNTLDDSKDYTFWSPTTYTGGRGLNGTGSRALTSSLDSWLDNIVSYKRTYRKHSLDATLVYSYNKIHSDGTTASASNFPNTILGYNGLSLGATQTVGQSSSSSALIGSMARLNYSYADRYLLTGTVRRDGYSAFGADNKFGVFPSMAAGWIASEESFLKNVKWLNFLKLRYSYGLAGNQGISPYSTLAQVGNNSYVFGNVTTQSIGQYVSSLANPTLGWETTLGSNYGLDVNVLKSRISLTADYYHYHTRNLLLTRALPIATGFSSVLSNIGGTANEGLEVIVNSVNITGRDFEWKTSFNISMNRNRITHLYGTINPTTGKELSDTSNGWFIGHPINSVYDYVFNGIYQTGETPLPGNAGKPGYIKVKDLNNDGVINGADRTIIGQGDPDYRIGINNTFKYKNFSFSFFVNDIHGGIAPNSYLDPAYMFAYRGNYLNVGWWTPDNKSNTRPSLSSSNLTGVSFYQSKSIVRVQDVSLSYTISKKWVQAAKINSLRVYVSAKNPFMFTKWTGYDPEVGLSGYPNFKTLAAGVNLGF
jgi:TonB-linked SusC/RagA family outer membrane protein